LLLGTLCSILAGLLLPSISYIVGYVSTTFGKTDYAAINKDISSVVKIVVIIAFCLFLFAYLFYAIWQQSAEKVTMKLKVMYLKALL